MSDVEFLGEPFVPESGKSAEDLLATRAGDDHPPPRHPARGVARRSARLAVDRGVPASDERGARIQAVYRRCRLNAEGFQVNISSHHTATHNSPVPRLRCLVVFPPTIIETASHRLHFYILTGEVDDL
jgi:hypothetical protein